jgi:hypothetical protein
MTAAYFKGKHTNPADALAAAILRHDRRAEAELSAILAASKGYIKQLERNGFKIVKARKPAE